MKAKAVVGHLTTFHPQFHNSEKFSKIPPSHLLNDLPLSIISELFLIQILFLVGLVWKDVWLSHFFFFSSSRTSALAVREKPWPPPLEAIPAHASRFAL